LPSYADLLRQAEGNAPRLIEAEAAVGVAEGLATQAAALPNPQLSVESEGFRASDSFRDASPLQNTISISETIEVGGKRGTRIAAERANVDATRISYANARMEFAYELAVAYATAEAEQARAQLQADAQAQAEDDVRAARALVGAGKESDLRALQAQAAASAARADAEGARAAAAEALLRISTMVGVAQPYTTIGHSLMDRATQLKTQAVGPTKVPPSVQAAEAERDAAEKRVEAERRRAISDLTLSVGNRRLPGVEGQAWVAGVSVALPIFDRNRGAVAVRRSELAAAEARLNATRLEAGANWRSALAQAQAAQNRLAASDETAAAASEAYRLTRIGYDAGRTSLLELLTTRRAQIDAQLRAVDARLARIQAEARLARLSGRTPFGEQP
jgi:cobalt-zinc-cadmium efflux system outer membrane protein